MAESDPKVGTVNIDGSEIDQGELDAVFRALREHADQSGYGSFISDEECRRSAAIAVISLKDYQSGRSI
jgi:hypothetical protein